MLTIHFATIFWSNPIKIFVCVKIAAAQNLSQSLQSIGVSVPDLSSLNKGKIPGQKYTQDYLGVSDFGVPAELLDLFYLLVAGFSAALLYLLLRGCAGCCCRSRSGKRD